MIRKQSTVWLIFLAVISLPVLPFLAGAALVALALKSAIARAVDGKPPAQIPYPVQLAQSRARSAAIHQASR